MNRRIFRFAAGALVTGPAVVGFGVSGAAGSPALTSSVAATTIVTATAPMTNLAGTMTPATATCPPGSTLVGGGIDMRPGVPGAVYTNGLKINGTEPGDGNTSGGATTPTAWTALGGFGGQSDPNDTVTASAVCATGGPGATVVVAASAVGTAANPAAGFGPVTADCPAGTTLLSGGASAVPAADGSLKPIAGYPSDAGGNPVAGGSTSPGSWSAFSRNSSVGGPANSNIPSTSVYALCARAALTTVVAESSTALTTATGSAVQTATTTCPAGDLLLSGGVTIDDGNNRPGPSQFGIHLVTDDATTAAGDLVTSGPATSWTATARTGGIPSTVGVHAYALCAGRGTPPPSMVTTTVASHPGGGATRPSGAGNNGATSTSSPSSPAGAPTAGATTSVPAAAGGGPAIAAPTVAPQGSERAAVGAASRSGGGGLPGARWVAVLVVGLSVVAFAGRRRLVPALTRGRPRLRP